MNKVMLIGEVTKDFSIKVSSTGTEVVNVGLKCNADETGKFSTFIDFVAFKEKATSLAENVKKGCKIYVEGRIQKSSYESNGQKIWKTDIVCERFEVLSEGGKPTKQVQAPNNNVYTADNNPFTNNGINNDLVYSDEDLPF